MNLEKPVPKITPKLSARNIVIALVACGLLVGCDDTGDVDQAAEEIGEESPVAEVLEGSVSDSMIEMDELRSQPPLGAGEDDGSDEDSAE